MNTCKVVTVFSSDTGNNSFKPDRRSLSRGERRFLLKDNSRIRSAPLCSVLKPVSYFEFRDGLPSLVTQKHQTRNGSVDSDTLRKEINSAVLLLESRNELDILPENNEKNYLPETRTEKCHYRVYNRNQLSQSAQRTIEQRVQNDNLRWKSAKISRDVDVDKNSKKCHLRWLSSNDLMPKNYGDISTKTATKPLQQRVYAKEIQPNLILSTSNSLTNFITIDDISGAKKYWIEGKQKFLPIEKETYIKQTINTSIDDGHTEPLPNSREDVLRQYMDVYMHWRTTGAIEEHLRLVSGKHRYCKSAKIRSATPNERLKQFKSIIDDKQSSVPKNRNAFTSTINKDILPTNVTELTNNDTSELSTLLKTDNTEKETVTNVVNNRTKVDESINLEEIEEDLKSDVYSEIDWLECEDI